MTKKRTCKIAVLFFTLLSLFIAAMAEAGTITSSNNTGTMSITLTINPKVSFDSNGGSGSMNAQVVSYDIATVLTANAFTRTGYDFNAWNTSSDGTGTSYADKASIKVSADKTLYAQWTPVSYAISYDLNGGRNNANNPTSYTITSPDITLQAPTKTGYTFANWTSGDVKVTSIPQGSTGDMTLKANWTANTYTVKFNSNGGTGSMSDLTLTYDVEQALSNNTFTRTGYTFNNWKDNDGNKTYNGGASVKNLTTVNGATITLYAQWKVNQYTLTFNTDGGTTINAITQDYGTSVTAPADPTKEGYTFNGWDKEIPSTMPAENLTFTALWTENEKTPDPDPVPESDDQKGSTDPKTDDPAQEAEESADKTPDTDSKDISSEDKTPESKTAVAEAVSTMTTEELQQTFENKTEITLTGTIRACSASF
ncbi:MAG: InlB B-repeat-containing protein [Synergistaceae bacterium]|nr:InlB B-repeat-containing protein [Synergistaceae bacterium]